jgi:hypothetical protein
MTRRTLDDWKVLIDKQIANGMSVPKFCQHHQLNLKYFYGRKPIIHHAEPQTNFVQAHVISQQTTLVSEHLSTAIILKTSAGGLSLPGTTINQVGLNSVRLIIYKVLRVTCKWMVMRAMKKQQQR